MVEYSNVFFMGLWEDLVDENWVQTNSEWKSSFSSEEH